MQNFRPLLAMVPEISTVFPFSYKKNLNYNAPDNNATVLWQTVTDRSPRCYIPSFVETGPPVLEKIIEGFLLYMGIGAILVMRPASYQQILISMYLKKYTLNLVKNGLTVSEKSMF